MPDEDEIVGLWSVEAGYYSAMEDEVFAFWSDGVGFVEYARPYTSDCIDFRWTRLSAEVLRLEPFRSTYVEDGDVLEGELPAAEDVTYRIVEEDRPLEGATMPVMYLSASFVTFDDQGHGLATRTPSERLRDPDFRLGE
ncbi:hypothetical protein [Nocardia aurantia]|uniref:Lipocalin-like domain-containing protein n=1 Tax=Nocardia aurantia TaxID=2585199 RepID=A0A7K0DJC9_9NOCA|nr:hypothetical protein [Nocardia aurantia]MQY25757.1 hypothetical protein [Nocardia aurantia]